MARVATRITGACCRWRSHPRTGASTVSGQRLTTPGTSPPTRTASTCRPRECAARKTIHLRRPTCGSARRSGALCWGVPCRTSSGRARRSHSWCTQLRRSRSSSSRAQRTSLSSRRPFSTMCPGLAVARRPFATSRAFRTTRTSCWWTPCCCAPPSPGSGTSWASSRPARESRAPSRASSSRDSTCGTRDAGSSAGPSTRSGGPRTRGRPAA
mmetsp:Transcript_148339/g.413225  ORF Transcript_148339/g.413225 Transcript_148339/m.413225 type:complete len:212 (+) Transcript_148339:483-1118(+)